MFCAPRFNASESGALMDLLWYGFPWHVQQIYRECRRQSHIAYSANSLRVTWFYRREGKSLSTPSASTLTKQIQGSTVHLVSPVVYVVINTRSCQSGVSFFAISRVFQTCHGFHRHVISAPVVRSRLVYGASWKGPGTVCSRSSPRPWSSHFGSGIWWRVQPINIGI